MTVETSARSSYEYVVVGGGSAGCIVAEGLASAGFRVLLLEAGDAAADNPETLRADGFKDAFANEDLLWHRMSTPQPSVGGRSLFAGTGRGMGGSGAVNGMVYTRGDKRDFASWPEGWQWDDLLPSFEAVEARLGIHTRPATPFAQRFLDASVSAGFRRQDELNDGDLAGVVGCNAMNFSGDERRSSYRAYLHEATHDTLTTICGAKVQRIILNGDKTAVAIEYVQRGALKTVDVTRDVVLCAGALETPRLLLVSGIGPADHLRSVGVDCLVDAPGVGQNLQDHPNVCLFYRSREPVDFAFPQVYGFDAANRAPDDATRPAPDTCFVCYAAPASIKHSMLRMLPVLALPGILYRVKGLRRVLRGLIHAAFALPPLRSFVSGVFGIVVILGKPKSRGRIRLNSGDPQAEPLIDLGYLSDPADRALLEAGIAKARWIAQQPAFAAAHVRPLSAGAGSTRGKSLWRWIHGAVMTTFHFCGSCKMGEDPGSPVDLRLRLKGVQNVMVVDASVMPEIPVSALNAPTMAIAHRAVEWILANSAADRSSDLLGEAA